MAFHGPGPGRPKGSRTKQQLQVEERLRELGCDPIEGMARIAMDEAVPIEVRARMFTELAQYIAPKRKRDRAHGRRGHPSICHHRRPAGRDR